MNSILSDYEIFEKIKKEICIQLPLTNADKINCGSRYINDLKADSLDIIELIIRFKSDFNIEIND